MPIVTLPDGSQRTFEDPLTIMQLAESIGPGLAKACVAGKIDGVLAVSYTHLTLPTILRV